MAAHKCIFYIILYIIYIYINVFGLYVCDVMQGQDIIHVSITLPRFLSSLLTD